MPKGKGKPQAGGHHKKPGHTHPSNQRAEESSGNAVHDPPKPTLYEILGVKEDASTEEIRKAYKKAAVLHHPDKGGEEEKFKEICKAYEILSDPQKRSDYDKYGDEALDEDFGDFSGFDINSFMAAMFGNAPFFDEFSDDEDDEDDFIEFQEFLRSQGLGPKKSKGKSKKRTTSDADTLESNVYLTMNQLINGAVVNVNLERNDVCPDCKGFGSEQKPKKPKSKSSTDEKPTKCVRCNGSGVCIQSTKVDVSIPGGLPVGSVFVVSNEGHRSCEVKPGKDQTTDLPNESDESDDESNTRNASQKKKGKGKKPQETKPKAKPQPEGSVSIHKSDLHVTVNLDPKSQFAPYNEFDLLCRLKVNLYEALSGLNHTVTHPAGHHVKVSLPSGQTAQPNSVWKIRGEGLPKKGGSGDLYVLVEVTLPETAANAAQLEQVKKWNWGSPQESQSSAAPSSSSTPTGKGKKSSGQPTKPASASSASPVAQALSAGESSKLFAESISIWNGKSPSSNGAKRDQEKTGDGGDSSDEFEDISDDEDDGDEDEYEDIDSDEDPETNTKSKAKPNPKPNPKPKPKPKYSGFDSDDDDDEDFDEDDLAPEDLFNFIQMMNGMEQGGFDPFGGRGSANRGGRAGRGRPAPRGRGGNARGKSRGRQTDECGTM